jgi:hypothetical protein
LLSVYTGKPQAQVDIKKTQQKLLGQAIAFFSWQLVLIDQGVI